MKIILSILSLLCCLSFAQAQNTNITLNSDLNLNCKFEKVILKNPDHNFESFTKDQIKRKTTFVYCIFVTAVCSSHKRNYIPLKEIQYLTGFKHIIIPVIGFIEIHSLSDLSSYPIYYQN